MSKKTYSAKETAVEVLKKAEEILKKAEFLKAKQHQKEDEAYEVKDKKEKGKARVESQVAPEDNKKEQKEEDKKGKLDQQLAKAEDGKSKHDRCAEHVKEQSPEVKNPHAACVEQGVRPEKWSKNENMGVAKLAKFMDRKMGKLKKDGGFPVLTSTAPQPSQQAVSILSGGVKK